MTRSKTTRLTLSGAASLLALSLASGNAWAEEKQFDIEAQPLAKALLEFNEQSPRRAISFRARTPRPFAAPWSLTRLLRKSSRGPV